jgi:hypothetical protein
MHPTLLVYGSMPARAWVMVWVEHPNEKSVEPALVPRTTYTALRDYFSRWWLLAKGSWDTNVALPGASE